jgi:hypothetical protein
MGRGRDREWGEGERKVLGVREILVMISGARRVNIIGRIERSQRREEGRGR